MHWPNDLVASIVLGSVQPLDERACPGKFAALTLTGSGPHAMVGRASQNGVTHSRRAAASLNVVTDSQAATRIANQYHLLGPRDLEDLLHLGFQERHALFTGTTPRLRDCIVVSRQGVGLLKRKQPVAWPAVGFKAPNRGLPVGA